MRWYIDRSGRLALPAAPRGIPCSRAGCWASARHRLPRLYQLHLDLRPFNNLGLAHPVTDGALCAPIRCV